MNVADYILPAEDIQLNPRDASADQGCDDGHDWRKDRVGIVLKSTHILTPGKMLLVTGYHVGGGFGYSEWKVGEQFECYHDQTDDLLGTFEVIGRINFLTGAVQGEVPNRPLPLAVFK